MADSRNIRRTGDEGQDVGAGGGLQHREEKEREREREREIRRGEEGRERKIHLEIVSASVWPLAYWN